MRLGIHLSSFAMPEGTLALAPQLAATARIADEGGCSALTLMDHWFQMESLGGPHAPMLDGYTTLGFLAGQTQRITLGLLCTGVTYRPPGLLAKTVATLDVLSGGRAQLGIGAAWYEREHAGLGVPFPPLAERYERLDEALRICRQMWSDDDGPFAGRHYRLAETICEPRPLRPGGPRILIGGSGERKTLRLVARHADACNLYAAEPEVIAHKLAVLDGHCASEGRDPATIERTVITGADPLADPAGFLATMASYAELGIELAWVSPPAGVEPAGWVEQVVERVLPGLREL